MHAERKTRPRSPLYIAHHVQVLRAHPHCGHDYNCERNSRGTEMKSDQSCRAPATRYGANGRHVLSADLVPRHRSYLSFVDIGHAMC